ncbi:hypothetical protein CC2G_009822 [Coprinopsis cinerea AmutBmut pab1-1]|nr:hypothetical protein CC2G_009822 [Coprinopsis cinerea AmutBmut pab1-1]
MRKDGKGVGRIYQLGRWCLKKAAMAAWTGAILGMFIVGIKIANGQEHAMRETGIAASVCAGVWFVVGVFAYVWKVNPMYWWVKVRTSCLRMGRVNGLSACIRWHHSSFYHHLSFYSLKRHWGT